MIRSIVLVVAIWAGNLLPCPAQRSWPLQEQRMFLVNPAMTSQLGHLNLGVYYAQRWSALPASPKAYQAYGITPINNYKMALGFAAGQDRAGPFRNNSGLISYAYDLPLTGGGKIALGTSTEVSQISLDPDHFIADQTGDQILDQVDMENAWRVNMAVGIFYQSRPIDRLHALQFYGGLSSLNMINSEARFSTFGIKLPWQFLGLAGIRYQVGDDWQMQGAFFFNHYNNNTNLALRGTTIWKDLLAVGFQYAPDQGFETILGLTIPISELQGWNINLSGNRTWYKSSEIAGLGGGFEVNVAIAKNL